MGDGFPDEGAEGVIGGDVVCGGGEGLGSECF